MKQNISRRSFLTGAVATGLAATGATLVGCGSPKSDGSGASSSEAASSEGLNESVLDEKWDFEIAPASITDDQVSNTISADIVVVGSGLSGMVTAVSAAQAGANVVVVSASSKGISRGGSNFAFGTKAQAAQGIDLTIDDMRAHVKQEQTFGGYYCDGGKWADWTNHSSEVMNWMIDLCASRGLEVSLEPGLDDPDGVLTIPACAHNFFNDEFPLGFKDGAPLQVNAMVDIFQSDLGGEIHFNTKVVQLIRGGQANGTEGAVEGCIAENADGTYTKYEASKAVVLATGDFSRNKSMMAKYAPWTCETFKDVLSFDEPDYNVEANWSGLMPGDGHMMALWVGAAWQKGPNAPMVCNGCAGPVKQGALANFWGINMNIDGKRYINEITNFAYAGIAITEQPEQTVFGIWDTAYASTQEAWDYYGCTVGNVNGCVPNTPEQLIAEWEANVEAGTYFKADTLEELVEVLAGNGLRDTEAALKTIRDYTAFAEAGHDDEFNVNPSVLYPVSTPPFYAAKSVGTQFLTICGGIRTNSQMQALDADDAPIDGLYTTGIMTGDFYGSTYNFVLPGLNLGGVCGTLSYLLGQRLAKL
ncbi:FAD-binding protein [Adlercreutzia sp. R21]|uniref:FAD-binding protein n=1 Tax=Adlercreutzia wanghongyangiae TaxID=3111451 RepID=UPI002DBC725C|nr:FAD-binding protein [Adlercreutzia sp. R21]MEC4184790.1 FAD-binding protein [Adlercreutzia sp. R21]